MSNVTIGGASTSTSAPLPVASTIDGTLDLLPIYTASATATQAISRNTLLGVTGTPADLSSTQTFTNKVVGVTNTITGKDSLFSLENASDLTKIAKFSLASITTGTTRTYTLPDASDTIVALGATQTLTNKTLTSPVISGGTYDNGAITVDSISGHTTSTIVTVGGLQINNGVVGTNGVATASIADAAVTPAKLIAGTGTSWVWQSFTPTLANLTLGNGTLVGAYTQIGKTVFFRILFTLGSSSSVGTSPTLTFPVTPSAFYTSGGGTVTPIGLAFISTAGSNYTGMVQMNSSTTMRPLVNGTASTYLGGATTLTASIPGTFTTSDFILCTGSYEAL